LKEKWASLIVSGWTFRKITELQKLLDNGLILQANTTLIKKEIWALCNDVL
jgi:hypothetical protein